MERFISVDIFREKSNTFLGTTVFFVFTEKTEIFRTINLWITRDGKKCTGILQMVHFNPFFGTKKKKYQYHLTDIFHRNFHTKIYW